VDRDIESLSVTEFMATVAELGLHISCIDCSGPSIPELSDLLSSLEESKVVTSLANVAFDFAANLIEGNLLRQAADRALNEAQMRCPHNPDYDPDFVGFEYESFEASGSKDSNSSFHAVVVVGASLLVAILAVVVTTKQIVRRRHRKWVDSLPEAQLQLLFKEQRKQANKGVALNEATKSMFRSDAISWWLQMLMPVIILVNIGFFLTGHFGLEASITIMASLGKQTFREGGFFAFSMASSIVDTGNGKLGQEMQAPPNSGDIWNGKLG
jgi:hypothetical protein